jgi:biuret amidohydrolase
VALLVIDVQNDILDLYGRTPWMEQVVGNIAHLIAGARAGDVPIVYVRVAFRPSFVDVMPGKPMIQERDMLRETARGASMIDELQPQPLDIVITKRRTGAFYMTDLELVLRKLGVATLLVTGMSTARAVESTVREAHNRDFNCVVVSDACLADTPKLHENALESMGDWFASIATTAQVREEHFQY